MSAISCLECGGLVTQVTDSRPSDDNTVVRRRRKCAACGARFSTYEISAAIFREMVEQTKDVADARAKLIDEFAATLPPSPITVLPKLRPARK